MIMVVKNFINIFILLNYFFNNLEKYFFVIIWNMNMIKDFCYKVFVFQRNVIIMKLLVIVFDNGNYVFVQKLDNLKYVVFVRLVISI